MENLPPINTPENTMEVEVSKSEMYSDADRVIARLFLAAFSVGALVCIGIQALLYIPFAEPLSSLFALVLWPVVSIGLGYAARFLYLRFG